MSDYNEKQVQIIEAAEKLFAAKGFDGTSVRDIAESANVNLAMISYYFGSKEKLMEAMFAHRSSFFKLQLENILTDKDRSPIQKMEAFIDHYIGKLMTHQCFHLVMVREQMVNNNGFVAQQIQQIKLRNLGLIRDFISEGQKSGQFKKNVDVSLLMLTITGTISQFVTTQHFYREINGLQEMREAEFQKLMNKKLNTHLKGIIKAILINEN